jgi:hypothetical protein
VTGGIVAFLEARWAEMQPAAILTRNPNWRVDGEPWHANGVGVVDDKGDPVAVAVGSYAAEHIALNDPGHVLADLAAKRAIVTQHGPVSRFDGTVTCETCIEGPPYMLSDLSAMEPYPCPTLRALGAPFASHPDFDQAWRTT